MLGAMQGLATPPGEARTKEGNREGRCERERVRERARESGGERWIEQREAGGAREDAREMGVGWDRGLGLGIRWAFGGASRLTGRPRGEGADWACWIGLSLSSLSSLKLFFPN